MAVADPIGDAGEELRSALEKSSSHADPWAGAWEASIEEGQPVIRVLIGDRKWKLRLKRTACCSGGKWVTYCEIASGTAIGELFLYCLPTDARNIGSASGCDSKAQSEIMCRIAAWLPRERVTNGPPVRALQLDHDVPDLEKTDIRDLRAAVRANQVSFPAQVPTFPEHTRASLQRKFALLYFVLGWNCRQIGARYGLGPARVRQILKAWKRSAVNGAYIQYVPPAQVMGGASLPTSITATPDSVT